MPALPRTRWVLCLVADVSVVFSSANWNMRTCRQTLLWKVVSVCRRAYRMLKGFGELAGFRGQYVCFKCKFWPSEL